METNAERILWDAAGLGIGANKVQVTKSLADTQLQVPSCVVFIEEQLRVAWQMSSTTLPRPVQGCLEAFIALAESNSSDVVRFVRKWGGLAIQPTERTDEQDKLKAKMTRLEPPVWTTEPVEVYFHRAKQLRATLRIASSLLNPDPQAQAYNAFSDVKDWNDATLRTGDARFWATGEHWGKPTPSRPSETDEQQQARVLRPSLETQRVQFTRLVTEYLLKPAYILPEVRWDSSTNPNLTLRSDCWEEISNWERERSAAQHQFYQGMLAVDATATWPQAREMFRMTYKPHRDRPSRLFSLLVLQALAAITSRDGLILCKCGDPFLAKRSDSTRCKKCQSENTKRIKREWHSRKPAMRSASLLPSA